jgi:Fe-S oxidoreductase
MWLINAWLNKEIDTSTNYAKILYTCVTCGNCKEHCALSFRDDLLNIFEAAKSELVSEGLIPPAVRDYFKALNINGNPYKEPQEERGKWAEGSGVEAFDGHEYLFYVGDVGSYDERGKKMARSVASVLLKAGVSMGLLGKEELSDGNDVKALGEKWLFQELAQKNIEKFNRLGINKIITLDPHAFYAFAREYPKLGGDFEVHHYTQVLSDLIQKGKFNLSPFKVKVTYHDPCYLGRHSGEYEAPREILKSIPGLELVEMRRVKQNALCCGGGGGNFFTDMLGVGEESPARVRVREAMETGAQVLAVACPLCSKMFDDAVKAEGLEEKMQVCDIAEILNGALQEEVGND